MSSPIRPPSCLILPLRSMPTPPPLSLSLARATNLIFLETCALGGSRALCGCPD